jgi:hypothetical protein
MVGDREIWLGVRLCASALGSFAVGVIVFLYVNASIGFPEFSIGMVFTIFGFGVASMVAGFLPGFFTLTMTPARLYPWRSLPALIVSALIGVDSMLRFVGSRLFSAPASWPGWCDVLCGWLIVIVIPSIPVIITGFAIGPVLSIWRKATNS